MSDNLTDAEDAYWDEKIRRESMTHNPKPVDNVELEKLVHHKGKYLGDGYYECGCNNHDKCPDYHRYKAILNWHKKGMKIAVGKALGHQQMIQSGEYKLKQHIVDIQGRKQP